jgi:pSer/pThr/pTyr-binding forkhead associated (FHA) protein
MSSAARITVMTGPDEGRSFDVLQELAHIGRDEDAQIVLTDPTVARHQASIARRGGRFALFTPFDGGAHVDGAAVPADRWVWLPSMAEIQLGDDTRVRFEAGSNGAAVETSPEVTMETAAPRKPVADPPPKDGSSSTARRRRKKSDSKRQVAKLTVDAAGTPLVQLGADGRLPEFHLSDTPVTESEQSKDASVRPWLALTAVGASALVSLFLMLWTPASDTPSTHSARTARESLTEFYGKDGADLEPYQKLLRQAAIERSQGRFKEERRLYLSVLDLINSWDASNARNLHGLTGKQTGRGKNSDSDLRKLLETLVSAP